MRRFNILFAFVAILLSSCVTDELDYTSHSSSMKRGIRIVGAVEDYDIKSVGTRADDDIADSYISEMTMFIFKADGKLIQGYSDQGLNPESECSSAINIQRGNPTFLIDTEEGILADLSGTSDTNVVYYDNLADDLEACNIYIVANAWHQLKDKLGDITKLEQLEKLVLEVDNTLAMPMDENGHHRGFPMIGKQNGGSFKLNKNGDNEGNAVATIPLKKLYSKVRFTMQVNAIQVVAGQTPKFTINKVEVFNVPKKAKLGRELDETGELKYDQDYTADMGINGTFTPSDYYYYTSAVAEPKPFVIEQFNKKTISHSSSVTTDDFIEFGFYMPEHKVRPNTITYPANINDDSKQYYKPAGVGQSRNGDGTISSAKIATFVRIHGTYTDHNGQILGVKYDIYLGQDNYNDFTIKRNQLLNNKLVITGLTNHKDAYADDESAEGNISIDHRVEIEDKGFNLSMERTAILDAHFEVRPLDIELSPKSQMTITIPEKYKGWISMEDDAEARSGTNSGLYVNTTTPRKGVRKYFTTDLVEKLNTANDGTITLTNNESGANTTKTFRIWFYIDENPNVYDKTGLGKQNSESGTYTVDKNLYRNCPVKFEYKYMGTDKDGNTITKDVTINFQQWNLWRVWSGDRYYDIEHEEEYLNNYASDVQYGGTQDGMAFGLEGIQLSKNVLAYWAEKKQTSADGLWDTILNLIISVLDSWLDFSGSSNNLFAKSGKEPYYDFYLSTDGFPIDKLANDVDKTQYQRDHQGLKFNKEIASTLKASSNSKAKIDGVTLTEDPVSAFSYCYNKNKRNGDGTINVDDIKWYLPAIDEIEDIALGAYDEFDQVFQNKKYWSCQPAYERNSVRINPHHTLTGLFYTNYSSRLWMEGEFFNDNTSRARATSVYTNGSSYSNIKSGLPSSMTSGKLTVTTYTGGGNNDRVETSWEKQTVDYSNSIFANPDGEYRGNTPRTEKCRIRAVYRSGTK